MKFEGEKSSWEKGSLGEKLAQMAQQAIERNHYKIYDFNYLPQQKKILVFIDTPDEGDPGLSDCIKVDRSMGELMEEDSSVPEGLTLEVSSPGVYRHLGTYEHFRQALGARVKIQLKRKGQDVFSLGVIKERPQLKSLKNCLGHLREVLDFGVVLELDEGPRGEIEIPWGEIKQANVEPRWEDLAKRGEEE